MASPNIWKTNKRLCIIACTALIVCIAVGSTLAYIIDKTDLLKNIFSPSSVEVTVTGNTVTNTGDTDAYVRMTAVVTLQSISDPNVYYGSPFVWGTTEDGGQYIGSYVDTTIGDWILNIDGYFYYPEILEVGSEAITLPTLVVEVNEGVIIPDGYQVSVQYLVTGIQATPTDAIEESWGGTVDSNGVYTPSNPTEIPTT